MARFGFAEKLTKTVDPRKRVTGTSYKTEGVPGIEKPQYEQEVGSAVGGTVRDVVPKLASPASAARVYQEMVNNDVGVDVSLRAGKTPVLGATFFVDPYDKNPENVEIAEFVDYNIFHSQSRPFLSNLEHILRFFEDSFSVLEVVWELREWSPKREGANRRQYTMLRKLAPRQRLTLGDVQYDDNGGIVSIKHNATRADKKVEEVTLPIEKILVFTLNRHGGNIEGKSILRTAYEHWYYKRHLYKIDAIQKERHALGIPKIRLQPGYTKADKEAAITLVKNLRTNEEAGMVLPPGLDVEFAKIEGQLVDVMSSADHHNTMIMLNMMVQFLLLGIEGAGGGRATSGSHVDMFMKSLKYVANLVCEIINLYLIPKIVAYNFDTDKFPQLKVRNIGETRDFQMWATAIVALIDKGAVTMDIETEQWVREQADMPSKKGDRVESISSEQNQIIAGVVQALSSPTGRPTGAPTPSGPSGPSGAGNNNSPDSTVGNVTGKGGTRVGAPPNAAV